MVDVPGPQLLAHDAGQRAAGGLGDIRHLQQRGVQLVAGAKCRQDGDTPQTSLLDQIQLAADQINGVHDVVVVGGEELVAVGRVVGGADGVYPQVGVDVQTAAGCRLGLVLPHGGVQRVQLSVDIGQRQRILIHQRQFAHTAAGQTLGGITAHAAQTEYDHMAAGELVQRVSAQQHLCAQKRLVHGVSRRPSCRPAPGRWPARAETLSRRCNPRWPCGSPRPPATRVHPAPRST